MGKGANIGLAIGGGTIVVAILAVAIALVIIFAKRKANNITIDEVAKAK